MESSHVLSTKQLDCLVSPSRQEIFACLRALGEGAATDIACHQSKSIESVCFHLRVLAKVGLIEVASIRPSGKRPSVVYRPSYQQLLLPKTEESEPLVRKSVMAGLRLAAREYEAASIQSSDSSEIGDALQILRGQVRLSPDDLKSFHQMLEQALQFAKDHKDPEGTLCNVTSLCCPTVKTRPAAMNSAQPSSS
jgi:DNA-binding transcriptional ArsR family regulator